MPFYVYRIAVDNKLEHIETFEKYRDAKLKLNTLRKAGRQEADVTFRMIHASNRANAERLLLAPRDERIIGD